VLWQWENWTLRIVETEAYEAEGDPACHTFCRPSARRFVAENPPGTAYVYLNYGVHWLFNVLVKSPRRQGFVLVRAVEILQAPQEVAARAGAGPGKLTRLLGIDGSHHGTDLFAATASTSFALDRPAKKSVIRSPRIGISRGQELLWRFSLRDHPDVSVPPRRLPE
jgi:DNA-3-methyladenine glycosylase